MIFTKSKIRLLNAIKGKKVDRVPVSLYHLHKFNKWMSNIEEYKLLMSEINDMNDPFVQWEGNFNSFLNELYLDDTCADFQREVVKKGNETYHIDVIETKKGQLKRVTVLKEGIHTVWETESFVKDLNDIEKLLSLDILPYIPHQKDDFDIVKEQVSDDGLIMHPVNDPVMLVFMLLGFENFLVKGFTEKNVIKKLLDACFELSYEYIKNRLVQGVGPVYRIIGPEIVTPPYFHKELFDEYVYNYDSKIIELIHSYGGIVRYHCHGRVGTILDRMADMGVDCVEPIEPPPHGDVTLKEARQITNNKMCLMGNIEWQEFYNDDKKHIDELVKNAIFEGGNERFVLMTTSQPIEENLDNKVISNIIQYFESAEKYGVIK